jgi:putative SOS response-associated peptidase YedK
MIDKRCAIICNGFYEWNSEKDKFFIHTDEEYVYLAGIYNESDELLIITRQADDSFSKIHSRIPLLMNRMEMLEYLKGSDEKISDKKLHIERTEEKIALF